MFTKMMVPVDLAHVDKLGHALDCAADLAAHYGVPVTYVGVTSAVPGKLGHTPEEFGERLDAFAAEQVKTFGISASGHVAIAHDPTTEVDDALMKAVGETGADLVVMASHIPGALDYVWPSNGGKLSQHAKCSVFLVRV